MKRFAYTASLAMALASITFAVAGCGSGSNNGAGSAGAINGTGISGIPTYGAGVATLPGGGSQISFSGANIYDDGVSIQGMTAGFNGNGAAVATQGTLTLGGASVPPGQTSTLTGISHFDPGGSQISIVSAPTCQGYNCSSQQMLSANIAGVLTLSPTFLSANFGTAALPAVQGLEIQLYISGSQIYGGTVWILTNPTGQPGQRGAYLQF